MTKLAQLIAKVEGFGKPGAIPTIRHNPGDLRHSPHSEHPGDKDAIGTIDTDQHGWQDLERQLRIYADAGLTLRQAIHVYAPPSENDTLRYLQAVVSGMHVNGDMPMRDVLKIQV